LVQGKSFKDSVKSAGNKTLTKLGEDFSRVKGGRITKRKPRVNYAKFFDKPIPRDVFPVAL